jgi:hypothetical protein
LKKKNKGKWANGETGKWEIGKKELSSFFFLSPFPLFAFSPFD